MEHQAVGKSQGKLFTDIDRRRFTTQASKKQCVCCDTSFLFFGNEAKKKKKTEMTHIKILTMVVSG